MAYQRWWKTVRDQQGNAVNGASVAVYNGGTGTLATVYDPNTDDSAPGGLANPFVTGANGVFGFMAADGEYDVKISGGSLATQQYRVTLNAANIGVVAADTLRAELAADDGASLIGYNGGLAGEVDSTQLNVNNALRSVYRFMSDAEIADAKAGTRLLDLGPAIQKAIDAMKYVWFPDGDYNIGTTLVQTQRNILVGESTNARLWADGVDLMWIGVAGGSGYRSIIQNLSLVSTPGAGHIFVQKNNVVRYKFIDLYLEQQNDDKSIYTHTADLGNFLGNDWIGGEYYHTYTATQPAFKFVVSGSAGATNVNRWIGMTINRGSKPWFYFESVRTNNYIYDIVLRDVLCEVTLQGIVVGLGVNGFVADNVLPFDLIAQSPTYVVTADMFYFGRGTAASNQPSRNISIRNYMRTDLDATLGAFLDFKFYAASGAPAQSVLFDNCSRSLNTNLLADLSGVFDTLITGSRITVSGTGYFNLVDLSGAGLNASLTPKSLNLTNEDLAMAAGVNNHALGSTTTILRCTLGGAARNLTGIVAPSGATAANPRCLWIYNAESGFDLTLLHDSTSATANRFYCPGGVNYVVPSRGGVMVAYDATLTRWVVLDK